MKEGVDDEPALIGRPQALPVHVRLQDHPEVIELCRFAIHLASHGLFPLRLADCVRSPRGSHAATSPCFPDWDTTGSPSPWSPMLRGTSRTDSTASARRTDSIRSVMDALRRVVRDLRLSARDAERSAGISGAQLFVLQSLAEEPASSLNVLADRTLTDQSSVSVVVNRL